MLDYKAIGEIIGGIILVAGGVLGGKKWGERPKSEPAKQHFHENNGNRRVRESDCFNFRTDFKKGLETMRTESREDFKTLHGKVDALILKEKP